MLRNYWYIASAASRLGAKPLAARVLDEDLVLFRNAVGAPAAVRDRCCHRGVRLSLGRVVAGNLACGYHGWQYDGNGKCVHIPSLIAGEPIPDNARIDGFPCCEQQGHVWVWMGGPATPDKPPMPIPGFDDHRWRQGSVPMQCPAVMGIENNLDWCHPYFAHPWRHGQFFATRFGGFREQCFEVRTTETGLIVFAPASADAQESVPGQPFVSLRFDLPDRVTVQFGRPFRQAIVMHFVPTGDASCRLEWLVTRFAPFGRRLRWTGWEPTIFAQDRRLLESVRAPGGRASGRGIERSVAGDTATLMARRILALASESLWSPSDSGLPPRQVVRVRS
jgi:phenylpropionate dioxygenase-like ring-hydroxylating dioxygenase large terminal subunit